MQGGEDAPGVAAPCATRAAAAGTEGDAGGYKTAADGRRPDAGARRGGADCRSASAWGSGGGPALFADTSKLGTCGPRVSALHGGTWHATLRVSGRCGRGCRSAVVQQHGRSLTARASRLRRAR